MPNSFASNPIRSFLWGTFVSALIVLLSFSPTRANGMDVINAWRDSGDDVLLVSYDDFVESGDAVTLSNFEMQFGVDQAIAAIAEIIGEDVLDDEDPPKASYTIKFPSLTFTYLRDEGSRYAARAIQADQMDIAISIKPKQNQQEQVTTMSFDGLAASNFSWAKIPELKPDAARPVSQFAPLLRAMVDVSFDSFTLNGGRLETDASAVNDVLSYEYDGIRMENAVNGDIKVVRGGPLKFRLPSEPGRESSVTVEIEIDAFSATDYNYGTLIETLFNGAGSASDDYRTLIGEMAITGWKISVPDENVEIKIGSILAEAVGVKSPPDGWLNELDALAVKGLVGEDFDMSEQELAMIPLKIYSVFSVGKYEFSDIDMTAPEVERGVISAYGVTDFSSDGLGSMYVKGVDFAGTNGEIVRYGEASINDVTFPSLEALIAIEKNIAEKNTSEILKAIPIVGSVVNSGVELNLPKEDVQLSIANSEVTMGGHIGPVPTRVGFVIDDLSIPVRLMDREARSLFDGLGYTRFDGSYDIQLSWDEATNDLSSTSQIELNNGGKLTGSALFGSVPRIVFERPDQTAAFSLLATTFKNADIRYDDNSLVERGVSYAAKQNNTDAASIKAQLMAMIPIGLAQLNDATFSAKVTEAISNVLENGSSLTLSAMTSAPLPVIALGSMAQSNPASLLQSLQVEVGNQ